ncbi:MAG: hypothetical protein ABI318_01940 [Chthoniobacteraceae bacterium]
MSVRKRIQLRIAYCLLTASAISVVACDEHSRTESLSRIAETQRVHYVEPKPALPITPLARSPFPEARPGQPDGREAAVTLASSRIKPKSAATAIYFLKVAVQVDSGSGSVAFNRGTRVRLVRQQDGKFLVTRNGTDFLVEKSQVTDDIASLSALARNSS